MTPGHKFVGLCSWGPLSAHLAEPISSACSGPMISLLAWPLTSMNTLHSLLLSEQSFHLLHLPSKPQGPLPSHPACGRLPSADAQPGQLFILPQLSPSHQQPPVVQRFPLVCSQTLSPKAFSYISMFILYIELSVPCRNGIILS